MRLIHDDTIIAWHTFGCDEYPGIGQVRSLHARTTSLMKMLVCTFCNINNWPRQYFKKRFFSGLNFQPSSVFLVLRENCWNTGSSLLLHTVLKNWVKYTRERTTYYLNQPLLARDVSGLRAVFGLELGKNIRDMVFHGSFCDK